MPLLRVNAGPQGPKLHASHHALHPALVRQHCGKGPVIVMIHGYKFCPEDTANCPHDHIFSLQDDGPCAKAISWPRRLGLGGPKTQALGIAFGWNARGSLWRARRSAQQAGTSLAELIQRVRRLHRDRPIHVIAHSLGAQVAFSALARLAPGDISRIIVLNGAAYQSQAQAALASPAGQRAELFNVTTGENAWFDFLFERLIRPGGGGDRALGRGLSASNAVTLRIDDAGFLHLLARRGIHIAETAGASCHWSTYLRDGVFDLYRTLFDDPARLSLDDLRHMTASGAERIAGPQMNAIPLMQSAKQAS